METGEVRSSSGIIIEAEGTRATMAREEAIIEVLGESSFDDLHPENRPKVGDRVVIPRYEGHTVLSARDAEDKLERRVIQDTRILCSISDNQ